MKPVVLDLQAFMPYGTRQVIDFRDLGTQRLMMIAGETGAGKTAVLDAMAYALFGASTGGGRTERSYRSHHATEGTLTYVKFQFELQGHAYRVDRYPPQKGKSQGVYELRRLSAIDDSDGELIASGKNKLGREVRRLLGYSLEQFRSVVMLPQGKFREFLAAKTDQKAEILSSLFRTGRYRILQEELQKRFKQLATQQADTRKQVEGILKRADLETEEQLVDMIAGLKREVDATSVLVKTRAEFTAEQLKVHEAAQNLVQKFEQLDAAKASLAAMNSKADERRTDQEKLGRARLAAQVAPIEKNLDERRTESNAAQERLSRSSESLASTKAAATLAQTSLETELARETERETARTTLITLRGLKEQVSALQPLIQERDALRSQAAQEKQSREQCERALVENKTAIDSLTDTLASQRVAAAQLGSAKAQHAECTDRLTRRRGLDDLKRRAETAERDLTIAKSEAAAATLATRTAKTAFEEQYQAHLSAYAAQLADGLSDDVPCPVCGSLQHPDPATPGDDAPDKDTVERARESLKKTEEKEGTAHETTRTARATAEPIRAALAVLMEQLGDGITTPITSLEQTLKDRTESLETATRAEAVVPETELKLSSAQALGVSLADKAKKAATAHEAAERQREAKHTLVEAQEGSIPEGLRTVAAVDSRIGAQGETLKGLEESLNSAREAVKTLGESVAETRTEEANAKVALRTAVEKRDEAEKTLAGRVADAGFADLDDYRSAKLAPQLCTELEQRLTAYDERLNQLRGQLGQLNAETEGQTRPDTETLTNALAEAKASEEEARESLRAQQTFLSPKEEGLAAIRLLKAESTEREAAFGVMATLAQAAQGTNNYRLKFERYVLAGLLDDVLVRASRRLKKMSNGRYTIRRTDPHRDKDKKAKIDRRSQAGLELEVVDAYTGRERDANTLSGGEGFQASLALALGLADVIQSQAGGIELSAMFIDEGFGTQSAEALDSVLDTLVGLQDSGRLVGFISHVDGMKDRIPAKLIVHKSATGSHAKFLIT